MECHGVAVLVATALVLIRVLDAFPLLHLATEPLVVVQQGVISNPTSRRRSLHSLPSVQLLVKFLTQLLLQLVVVPLDFCVNVCRLE